MKNASGAQQLALLSDVSSIPTVSVRFQLSQDTRKIGRRHVAEIRQMLAERQAARNDSNLITTPARTNRAA
ncbi:MAG: hypothetical protein O3B90_11720 [Actinomycetota bacterium]|uniref:hypothetical protein n=1 Tax=uncultured Ilumatobacter sp. TaxID=879968 RepID=UPI00374E7904|nr:hypothetical protein [Actinomycetota bacterium]